MKIVSVVKEVLASLPDTPVEAALCVLSLGILHRVELGFHVVQTPMASIDLYIALYKRRQ